MAKSMKQHEDEALTNLAKDFHELVTNKDELPIAVENFFNNLLDELTLGVIFDLHRKYKTGVYKLEPEEKAPDEEKKTEGDIFGHYDLKKIPDVTCPNCDRTVGACKFAPHLETCMGMGRSRSRNASRRVANTSSSSKDRENATFSGVPSDDEDDMDWNSGNKRGKKKKRNGNKKGKGTPKKGDPKAADAAGGEAECEEADEVPSMRDIFHDHSNSSSPAESALSSQSNSGKKKEKSKNKKNKRDRTSPSSSISAD